MSGNVRSTIPTAIDDYQILDVVGEGAVGTVYKAQHRKTGDIVALKVMAPHLIDNEVLLKRFEQEFSAAKIVQHPNIVRFLAYHGEGELPYLVMEYVDGESLGETVERDGPLSEAKAIQLIVQVCQGLYWAHKQGIIHRDIKPDNIMVTKDGQAKLTDLGLAKDFRTDEQGLTNTGRGLGTPHYMSPEQFRNAKNADLTSDIYGIGATLYTMVTGAVPFEDCGSLEALMRKSHNEVPSPRQLVPTLSERIDRVIRKAMSGNPNDRHPTCKDFARELAGGTPNEARPVREARSESAADKPTENEMKLSRSTAHELKSDRATANPGTQALTAPIEDDEEAALPALPTADTRWEYPVVIGVVVLLFGVAGAVLYFIWQ